MKNRFDAMTIMLLICSIVGIAVSAAVILFGINFMIEYLR